MGQSGLRNMVLQGKGKKKELKELYIDYLLRATSRMFSYIIMKKNFEDLSVKIQKIKI